MLADWRASLACRIAVGCKQHVEQLCFNFMRVRIIVELPDQQNLYKLLFTLLSAAGRLL